MIGALSMLLLAPSLAAQDEPGDGSTDSNRLLLGERLELQLTVDDHPVPGMGAARIFRVAPGSVGFTSSSITVEAESVDGDVLLALLGVDGTSVAEDDDGGVETNARLVVNGITEGAELRFLVAFKATREADVSLSAHAGVVEPATGQELALARGRWRAARGHRRLARDEAAGACSDLIQAASLLFNVERYAEVVAALGPAEPLLDEHAAAAVRPYARAFHACSVYRLGYLGEARKRLEAALSAARSAGIAPVEMLVASDLGRLMASTGEQVGAEAALTRALELSHQLGDRANELLLQNEMARLFLAQGWIVRADQSCKTAEALAGELGIPRLLSETLATRARWYIASGDVRSAEAPLEQAVLLSAYVASRANLLGELGQVRQLLGDPRGATHAFWQAAEIAAELKDPALLATALMGMGGAHFSLDEPLAAKDCFEAALKELNTVGDPRNRALCMTFLSETLSTMGEGELALAEAMKALKLAQTLGDRPMLSNASSAVRFCHYLAGNFEQLEKITRDHLTSMERAQLPAEVARAHADLAEVHFQRGRLKEAQVAAQIAFETFEGMRLDEERVAFVASQVLTKVAIARGDLPAAEVSMDRMELIARRIEMKAGDAHAVSTLRSGEVLHTVAQLAYDLTALRVRKASAQQEVRAALDEGLRLAGQWKGLELAEGLQTFRRAGSNPETSALLQERRRLLQDRDDVVSELLAAVAQDLSQEERQTLSEKAHGLDGAAQQIAAQLAELSPQDASLEGLVSWGLAEVRASLASDEVYIEFVEGQERLYSFVVSRDSAQMHDLGEVATRRREVDEFVAGLSQRERLASCETIANAGAEVWGALIGRSLDQPLPGGSRLVIVPSGSLSTLPFEALVLASADEPSSFEDVDFVLDEHEVVYASSGPVFAALQSSGPRATPGRALVLGDPVYDAPSTSTLRGTRDPRSLGFTRIPGTRDEALALARVLLKAAGAESTDFGALDIREQDGVEDDVLDLRSLRLVLGRELTPDVLTGDLREFGLIHAATHGHMDVHDPGLTGLALTPSASDDGFVTTADILELTLDADLAVLSACETARGRVRKGEGALSLSRAFLYAGARSVVSSMWPVDDRETERTMKVFYDGMLSEGLTVSSSLRAARLAIRHGKPSPDAFRGVGRGSSLGGSLRKKGGSELAGHPYFWAPFVYVGPTSLKLAR